MSDEGVNVDDGHGHHVTKLIGKFFNNCDVRGGGRRGVVLEAETLFKPRARSLCVMAVPATG